MFANLRGRIRALSAKQWSVIGAIGALVVAGAVTGIVVSGGSTHVSLRPSTTTTIPVVTTTTMPGYTVAPGYCPLTDVRAPDGVPDRPALAVKVGNEPDGARPQSGLNEADVVFDTPAEGFIMRYIAVYQCGNATQIGPDRSVRWVDWHVLRMLHDPILSYAGGIGVNLNIVQGLTWAKAENLLGNAGSAGIRTTNRVAPDNLYTSTAALYRLAEPFTAKAGPPPAIFPYSAATPAGATPLSSVRIDFSYGTDAIWTWSAAAESWIHSYSDSADIDALTGQSVSTTNVVMLVVHYKFGKYAEHIGGSGDFESQTLGSGSGYLLRNGTVTKITWKRKYLIDPWTFVGPNGKDVSLAPGRTWVELVPDTTAAAPGAVTFTP
jgi:hypothetical protein